MNWMVNMRNHVIDRITQLAKTDERIILMTADLGFSVLENFAEKFKDRYINVGIAEQNMTSVAVGLALEGNMVFTYSIGNFPTLRCLEQIRNLVCYHDANVKILAVGGGFAYGSLGMTHHATEDIAVMRALPNMKVYVPADEVEAIACLEEIYKTNSPCYLRMARGKEPSVHNPDVHLDVSKFVPVVTDGHDVVLLATGTIVAEAVRAQKFLKDSGIVASVYSVPCIKPMDNTSLDEFINKSKLIVTIEEHNIVGGLGSAVSELLSTKGTHAPLVRIGLNDEYTVEVGEQDYLRDYYGLSAHKVYDKILKAIRG